MPAYEQRILSSTTIFLSPLRIPGKLGDTGGRGGERRGDKISSEMSIDNDDGGEIPRGDACSEELAEERAVGRDVSPNANNNNNGDDNGRILIARDS